MGGEPVDQAYLNALRRELLRAQARLRRAEQERDRAREESRRLRELLARNGIAAEPEENSG
jgi:multidrug resistance efflux pump